MNVVNSQFEQLERQGATLSNGSTMDLYVLKKGVTLFGVSIEGDDYIAGPLFYGAGDAVLNSLTKMFVKDTLGVSNTEFVFNSMIRIREYEVNSELKFYDARNSNRPLCSDVGVNNFKTVYEMKLPFTRSADFNTVLNNVIIDKSEKMILGIECLTFCDPGKTLRINKSFRLDMKQLWSFYAGLIVKNYLPDKIRSGIFLDQIKSVQVISSIIQNRQIPSAVGDLPIKLIQSIDANKSLDELSKENSSTTIGQQLVLSGPFFKRLWDRDVKSLYSYVSQLYFLTNDSLRINTAKLGMSNLKPINPYVSNWFFNEDLMSNMGFESTAYSWNYNRYLDVNTTIRYIMLSMVADKMLIDTPNYNVQKHLDLVAHRFTDNEIKAFTKIDLYDSLAESCIHISVDKAGVNIDFEILRINNPARPLEIRKQVQIWIKDYITSYKGKLELMGPVYDLMAHQSARLQGLKFATNNLIISGVSLNWYFLLNISSILRMLITKYEFSFFSYA